MNWAEFALIAIISVAVIVLAYLNFDNFNHFMENYFIIIIIIIFVILIITLNFDNSIAITTYMKVSKPLETALIYDVPTQDDPDISNIMSFSFSGVYNNVQVPVADNTTGVYTFNYNALTPDVAVDVPNYITSAGDPSKKIFKITKLAGNKLKLEVNDVLAGQTLDGYVTFALLAMGNQKINDGFSRLQ